MSTREHGRSDIDNMHALLRCQTEEREVIEGMERSVLPPSQYKRFLRSCIDMPRVIKAK